MPAATRRTPAVTERYARSFPPASCLSRAVRARADPCGARAAGTPGKRRLALAAPGQTATQVVVADGARQLAGARVDLGVRGRTGEVGNDLAAPSLEHDRAARAGPIDPSRIAARKVGFPDRRVTAHYPAIRTGSDRALRNRPRRRRAAPLTVHAIGKDHLGRRPAVHETGAGLCRRETTGRGRTPCTESRSACSRRRSGAVAHPAIRRSFFFYEGPPAAREHQRGRESSEQSENGCPSHSIYMHQVCRLVERAEAEARPRSGTPGPCSLDTGLTGRSSTSRRRWSAGRSPPRTFSVVTCPATGTRSRVRSWRHPGNSQHCSSSCRAWAKREGRAGDTPGDCHRKSRASGSCSSPRSDRPDWSRCC